MPGFPIRPLPPRYAARPPTGRGAHALWLALLAGALAASGLAASEPNAGAPGADLPPLRSWAVTGNLRASAGYKENVLLSAIRSDDSAFARGEAEIFWWRMPTERFEALAFANAALTRFFDSAENPREWQAFAHGEARWFASPRLHLTGVVEGYHLDQVFDLSASNVERLTAQLAVTGALTSAALRWNVSPAAWLELKPSVQRDRYRDGSDDNTQRIGRLTLGRAWFDGRLELSVAGQWLARNYDRRTRYTVGGRPLPGTDLDFAQRDVEAAATLAWDPARRWTSTLTALAGRNADNASGYFNYHRRGLRHELAWHPAPWKLRLTGRAARYDYDVQTQGIGMNPPARLKEEFLAQARIERTWTPRTTVFADFTWERSRSNDPLATYRVQTASAGVDWAY